MKNKSAFIVKFHHTICDGPSSFNTICSVADNWDKSLLLSIRSIPSYMHFISSALWIYNSVRYTVRALTMLG